MKKIIKGLVMAFMGLALTAGSALATPVEFDMVGSYTFQNNSGGLLSETMTFYNSFVFGSTPAGDAINFQSITLPTLTIDETDLYKFTTTTFDDGFIVNNFFTADITFEELIKEGPNSASINKSWSANLSDIQAHGSYVAGTSFIADQFITYGNGTVMITLQKHDLFNSITNGVTVNGSYSGTAASPAPVPEPATMLLFGAGLAGLAGAARRRMRKA